MSPVADNSTAALDATFAALADPTRRAIVERLGRGRATVGELVQPFTISWPAVSRHLRVLENAGLLKRHRAGLHRVLELNSRPLDQINQWIEHHRRFWEGSLDSLAAYLERGVNKPAQRKSKKTKRK